MWHKGVEDRLTVPNAGAGEPLVQRQMVKSARIRPDPAGLSSSKITCSSQVQMGVDEAGEAEA